MSNRTFTIVKPDSVANGNAGKIIARIEAEGFRILAGRMTRLSQAQARGFYAVHAERPFYNDLVAYMTSGPVWVMALERDNAVPHLRAVMGATNPAQAEPGTIRALYGESIERNAIHGSDSNENATIEIAFFFSSGELV
ncbi:MAG: nucleoside-diphosphate kinase [Thermoanaerobaculales bacterium]|jgi:nucleoside-diphosphate kinase|nr:nucleoside-diphosphate kinase [Thermoanaerobaculales bacterium]